MTNEEQYFALGAGRLYLAPASVSEAEARSLPYYAGSTKGGVTLAYSARVHEITDYFGALVRSLRYGERIRVEGRLARLYPAALARATGSRFENGVLTPGAPLPEGRLAQIRVTLVCALPDGKGEFVFSMLATPSGGFTVSLSPERDSSVSFSLAAETDGAGLSGRMVFA